MKPQTKTILKHLESGTPITPLGALYLYNCFRLASRINELRHLDYDIKTDLITKDGKRFASYSLVKTDSLD